MDKGFFDRVTNLIRGAALSFVEDLERANPAAVIQAAIDVQTERIRQASRLVTRLRTYLRELEKEQRVIAHEVESLESRAAELAGRDDDHALRLLEQKHARLDRVAEIKTTMAQTEARIKEALEEKETAAKDLEVLKLDKKRILAEQRSARLQGNRADLDTGTPANAADAALARIRERLESLGAAGTLQDDTRPSRTQKALEDLQALKEAHRSSPRPPAPTTKHLEPPAPDAEGRREVASGTEDASGRPPADLPKRTL